MTSLGCSASFGQRSVIALAATDLHNTRMRVRKRKRERDRGERRREGENRNSLAYTSHDT